MHSVSSITPDTDTLNEELKGSIEKTFSNTEQSQQFGIECMAASQKKLLKLLRSMEA